MNSHKTIIDGDALLARIESKDNTAAGQKRERKTDSSESPQNAGRITIPGQAAQTGAEEGRRSGKSETADRVRKPENEEVRASAHAEDVRSAAAPVRKKPDRELLKPYEKNLPHRTGKRDGNAYTFLCPNCGLRLVNDDCVVDLREAFVINRGRGTSLMLPRGLHCTLPVTEFSDGKSLSMSAGALASRVLESAGYELAESVEWSEAAEYAGFISEKLKNELNLSTEGLRLFEQILELAGKRPEEQVLRIDKVLCTMTETDVKEMPAVNSWFQIHVHGDSSRDHFIQLLRCCPECGDTLASFLGSREEVFVGLKGKTFAGKTTFLCALARDLLNQQQGRGLRSIEDTFGIIKDSNDGAGGWNDKFGEKYEHYQANNIPGKNSEDERVHFTVKGHGNRFVGGKSRNKSNMATVDKVPAEKIITFADIPGEYFIRGKDLVARATENADFLIICVTPGQVATRLREQEARQIVKEKQETAAAGQDTPEGLGEQITAAGTQSDEDRNAEMEQAKRELDMGGFLKTLGVQPKVPFAVMLCKSDFFEGEKGEGSWLYPTDSKEDEACLKRMRSDQYHAVKRPELQKYSSKIRAELEDEDGGRELVSWVEMAPGNREVSGYYFSVSCGNRGGGNADATLRGLRQPMLWIFARAGLLCETTNETTAVKSGFLKNRGFKDVTTEKPIVTDQGVRHA